MTAMDAGATITVLCVDDHADVARAVARVVSGIPGFVAVTATSGEDALAILRARTDVDVLVSDIDMPGMSGLDLIRTVRVEAPTIARVLLTGAGTMDRALQAINEGEVARFFTKPFDRATLTSALAELGERVLARRRERGADAARQRREALFRWIEERYPGALEFERDPSGEVVVGVARLRAWAATAPHELRALDPRGRGRS